MSLRPAAALCVVLALGLGLGLGAARAQQTGTLGSVTQMKEKLRARPRDPQLLYELALATEQDGDVDGARDAYERLLQVDPENPLALGGLGWILLVQGDYRGSIDCSRMALERRQDLHPAQYNIGLAHALAGELPPAVDAYRMALSLDPLRSHTLRAAGDVNGFRDRQPDRAALHYVAAMLYGAIGFTALEQDSLLVFVRLGGPPPQLENAYRRLGELGAMEAGQPAP